MKKFRSLPRVTIPSVTSTACHGHAGHDKFESCRRARESVKEPLLLLLAEHRAFFQVAVLACVENEKLHRSPPSKRAINSLRLARRTTDRPIVQKSLAPDRRQRIARQIVVRHFVVVPNDVKTGFAKTSRAPGIVAVNPVFRPKFVQCVRGTVAIGVNCVAQMHEEIRSLRAHGVHDRKRLVAFPGVGAEAKSHFCVVIRARGGDKASNGSRHSASNLGSVIITRPRLQLIKRDLRRVIRLAIDGHDVR